MKTKLFLDFDDTIINARQAYCEVYNTWYENYPEFKIADWKLNNRWDLKDVAPLVENPNILFELEDFFECCKFINKNTFDVLKKASEKYEIIICSIGNATNISLKMSWIKYNLPFIKKSVLLYDDNCEMNKSIVNMQGGIFVDDVVKNLESSNADIKICFNNGCDWNKGWNGINVKNYDELEKILF